MSISACSKQVTQWELELIRGNCPPKTYSKVYLAPCSTFSGIQIELIGVGCDRQLYLSVLCLQLSPSSSDNTVDVVITIEDQSYIVSAALLEGRQRILLPDEARDLIVYALLNNQEVTVSVGRYRQILIIDNFRECMKL